MAKIKICGLKTIEGINCANEFLPDYVGFVFAKSKRQITDEAAAVLKRHLSPRINSIGVFVNDEIEHISKLTNDGVINMIQLHGDEDILFINRLRKLTDCPIIKAVRVQSEQDITDAKRINADYLLLDSFVNGKYGGSGKCFDKSLIPNDIGYYFLAGGLNKDNIVESIEQCNPFCVDISSGVETDGFKDSKKIKEIITLVRNQEAKIAVI